MSEVRERYLSLNVVDRIAEIPAAEWDACAGHDNPTVSHAFLLALEESGSASAETGWLPQHLVLSDTGGHTIAVVPLYLKSHSFGEYVFDWGWAEAYERAGGQYYPKLQCSVPFTPVAGPRILVRPGVERAPVEHALIDAMKQVCEAADASSLHITYPTAEEWRRFEDADLLQRVGLQYHWTNRGYRAFEDFLEVLSSRKRKAIRKERREVADSDLTVRPLTGKAIEERHWRAFHRFYLSTVDRKWANAYLTEEFFMRIGETMPDSVLLVVAERDGEMVAGAFNLIGRRALYGRNWGSLEEFRFLHFEACYYQAIDYAIEHGLESVEAGAQGRHKVQRGYMPQETYSAHWLRDHRFSEAVADFLRRERQLVSHEKAALAAHSPFRKD